MGDVRQKEPKRAESSKEIPTTAQMDTFKHLTQEYRKLITPYMPNEFVKGGQKKTADMTMDEAVKIRAFDQAIFMMAHRFEGMNYPLGLNWRKHDADLKPLAKQSPDRERVQAVFDKAVLKTDNVRPEGYGAFVDNLGAVYAGAYRKWLDGEGKMPRMPVDENVKTKKGIVNEAQDAHNVKYNEKVSNYGNETPLKWEWWVEGK